MHVVAIFLSLYALARFGERAMRPLLCGDGNGLLRLRGVTPYGASDGKLIGGRSQLPFDAWVNSLLSCLTEHHEPGVDVGPVQKSWSYAVLAPDLGM